MRVNDEIDMFGVNITCKSEVYSVKVNKSIHLQSYHLTIAVNTLTSCNMHSLHKITPYTNACAGTLLLHYRLNDG